MAHDIEVTRRGGEGRGEREATEDKTNEEQQGEGGRAAMMTSAVMDAFDGAERGRASLLSVGMSLDVKVNCPMKVAA